VVPPQDCPVITRIEWDWGDGNVHDSWFRATHTHAAPGDYTVTVTAYNAAGNWSAVADGDPLDFDALDVDETTLAFGPAGAPIRHVDDHAKDADQDGDLDMLVHFYAQETGLTCDDTTATLTGMTFGAQAITGTDVVTMMHCLQED